MLTITYLSDHESKFHINMNLFKRIIIFKDEKMQIGNKYDGNFSIHQKINVNNFS